MSLGDRELRVVKVVQDLLEEAGGGHVATPDTINLQIDRVLLLFPAWAMDLDRLAVTHELIRRHSVWVGADTSLSSDAGHVDWLSADRKRDWRYWQRYSEFLALKLSWNAIDGLDQSTDNVLRQLEDPLRDGPWDRRGLVVGHVQSGKTGNYTGLICKAADAGYKIIIVLAGMHNNLRSQTQMRLDEGFLGFETSPDRDASVHRSIGVGVIDGDFKIRPNYGTNRADKGDFGLKIAQHFGVSPEVRPWLFVVKKNKSVLDQLYRWIRDHVANRHDADRHLVTHLPLLMIDDEADNASVDTREQLFDEDGTPDEEHEPTAINRLTRRILHSFERSAYVGYTATPFANIFIHERGETRLEGPDLFPAAFIINLAAPSNYVGPSKVFGSRANDNALALPVVITLAGDQDLWMPSGHKKDHVPLYAGQSDLPPSLAQAVDSFVLACAARRLRGQQHEHCSMLVHVTRFSSPVGESRAPSVQHRVADQIEAHVQRMRQRLDRGIDADEVLVRLEALWEKEFTSKAGAIASAFPDQCGPRTIGHRSGAN